MASFWTSTLSAGEVELAGDHNVETPAAAEPQFDAGALAMSEGTGFPTMRCKKALLGVMRRMRRLRWCESLRIWIILTLMRGTASRPLEEPVGMLAEMGFTSAQARKALRETTGNTERVVEWLFRHLDDTGEDSSVSAVASEAAAPPDIGGS